MNLTPGDVLAAVVISPIIVAPIVIAVVAMAVTMMTMILTVVATIMLFVMAGRGFTVTADDDDRGQWWSWQADMPARHGDLDAGSLAGDGGEHGCVAEQGNNQKACCFHGVFLYRAMVAQVRTTSLRQPEGGAANAGVRKVGTRPRRYCGHDWRNCAAHNDVVRHLCVA